MDKEKVISELRQKLKPAKTKDEILNLGKQHISKCDDPEVKFFLDNLLSTYYELGIQVDKTLVFLVHGIETHAIWQDKIKASLQPKDNIKVFPIKYGDYYSIVQFSISPFTEKNQLDKLCREIREIKSDFPVGKIIVIAHSFGTHLVSKILKKHSDIRLEGLILCGSVIPSGYNWDAIPHPPKRNIINDIGTRDIVPILAKVWSRKFGSTGTFSFGTNKVIDRHHDIGHSGFFNEEFFSKYWLPYIKDGTVTASEWSSKRLDPPMWKSYLNKVSLKWIIFTFLLIYLYIKVN